MPSSIVVMAVAYGAGAAAAAAGYGALAVAVIGAAAGATAGTAINGGSWGEQFGLGLLGAGIASGVSAGIGSAAGSAGAAASEGITQGVGQGLAEGTGQALGEGLAEGATSGLGGAIGPSLESSLGAASGLEGSIGAATGSDLGTVFSGGGEGLGSSFGSGSGGDLASGMSSGGGANISTGAFDSGTGFGMDAGSSIASPSSVPTGEGMMGGGLEGFQTNSPLSYPSTPAPQLGSGMYNSDPTSNLGFNGSNVTGGYSDLGTTSLPNAGNEIVTPWEKDLQTVKNGLGSLWDSTGIGFNAKTGLKAAGGLYDMYARNKASQGYNQTLNSINNMYAPGSAEYNLLQQKLDRQNAAAGRRSQSLTNAGNFAQQVTTARNQALTSPQYLQTMNARNQNKFNGLGSLFNFAGGMF